jgi:hypothetical protein
MLYEETNVSGLDFHGRYLYIYHEKKIVRKSRENYRTYQHGTLTM